MIQCTILGIAELPRKYHKVTHIGMIPQKMQKQTADVYAEIVEDKAPPPALPAPEAAKRGSKLEGSLPLHHIIVGGVLQDEMQKMPFGNPGRQLVLPLLWGQTSARKEEIPKAVKRYRHRVQAAGTKETPVGSR